MWSPSAPSGQVIKLDFLKRKKKKGRKKAKERKKPTPLLLRPTVPAGQASVSPHTPRMLPSHRQEAAKPTGQGGPWGLKANPCGGASHAQGMCRKK